MATLASSQDVAARWRVLSAAEASLATVLLTDAEGIVRVRVPSVDARVADGTLPADVVAGVLARMVLRVMRNPDGKVSESVDDYSYRRADAIADGSLYLALDEIETLSPAGGSGEAFTISPQGQPGYRAGPPWPFW